MLIYRTDSFAQVVLNAISLEQDLLFYLHTARIQVRNTFLMIQERGHRSVIADPTEAAVLVLLFFSRQRLAALIAADNRKDEKELCRKIGRHVPHRAVIWRESWVREFSPATSLKLAGLLNEGCLARNSSKAV